MGRDPEYYCGAIVTGNGDDSALEAVVEPLRLRVRASKGEVHWARIGKAGGQLTGGTRRIAGGLSGESVWLVELILPLDKTPLESLDYQ